MEKKEIIERLKQSRNLIYSEKNQIYVVYDSKGSISLNPQEFDQLITGGYFEKEFENTRTESDGSMEIYYLQYHRDITTKIKDKVTLSSDGKLNIESIILGETLGEWY